MMRWSSDWIGNFGVTKFWNFGSYVTIDDNWYVKLVKALKLENVLTI